VRIVAPIPGKNTVGVELPNERRQLVRLADVMNASPDENEELALPLFLGKGVTGDPIVTDLTKMPHLLIAGQTGTGKSVCLNSIIVSILMTRSPDEVRMLMVDPKQVEFGLYQRIPHLLHPVVDDMQKAAGLFSWTVNQMEERYHLLKKAGVRNITEYNKLSEDDLRRRMNMIDASDEEWEEIPQHLPYLVVIADEVADLIMSAKEVESHIIRLAQKSRAAGIHLILATQKPTANVFTSAIKSNLPARIAFRVSCKTDRMVILDRPGAEQLLGKGDMLLLSDNEIIRGQGAYVADEEIEAINEQIATDEPDFDEELLELDTVAETEDSDEEESYDGKGKIVRDETYYKAVDLVIQKGRGSVSMLQTCLSIGYPRASRMMDFMEEDGVVGKANGSKPRNVLVSMGDWRRKRNTPKSGGSQPPGTRREESYYEEEEEVDFVAT
jgi:S-DNA-T family DNA segregation ATPase FtsK/SpoIIIE